MRWSCPHCGVNLALGDEKLGSGWSFSRCYKCGGFALVRKASVNLIKVDKAPQGEQVLLPEANEEPVYSQEVTNRITELGNKNARRNANTIPVGHTPAIPLRPQIPSAPNVLGTGNSFVGASLPPPLPEVPLARSKRARILPVVTGVAGIFSVISGVYLYMQSQSVWQRTSSSHGPRAASGQGLESKSSLRSIAASQDDMDDGEPTRAIARPIITDQVHQNAMAPMRDAQEAPSALTAPIRVKLTGPTANLHDGPGMQYRIAETISGEAALTVVDWKDRWFKVRTPANPMGLWVRNDLVELTR